jgi:hypothetical protein
VNELQQLRQSFHERSDFVLVYISEAHAANEWPVGDRFVVDQPTDLAERIQIATEFRDLFSFPETFPIVVDHPGTDSFDKIYACWPTRFYGINSDGTIGYKAEPGPSHEYDLGMLRQWLEQV